MDNYERANFSNSYGKNGLTGMYIKRIFCFIIVLSLMINFSLIVKADEVSETEISAPSQEVPDFYHLENETHRWGPDILDGVRQSQEITIKYTDDSGKAVENAKALDVLNLVTEVVFHNPHQRSYAESVLGTNFNLSSGNSSIFRPSVKVVIPKEFKVLDENPEIITNEGSKVVASFVDKNEITEGIEYTIYFDYHEFDPASMSPVLREHAGGDSFKSGFPLHPDFTQFDDTSAAQSAGIFLLEEGDKTRITFKIEIPDNKSTDEDDAVSDVSKSIAKTYAQSQTWADPTNDWTELGTKFYTKNNPDPAGHDPILESDPTIVKVVSLFEYNSKAGYGTWFRGATHAVYGVQDNRYELNINQTYDLTGKSYYNLQAANLDDNFQNIAFEFVDPYRQQISDEAQRKELQKQYLSEDNIIFDFAKDKGDQLRSAFDGFSLENSKSGSPGLPHPIEWRDNYGEVPNSQLTKNSDFYRNSRVVPISSYLFDKNFNNDPNVYSGSLWVTDGTQYRYTLYLKNRNNYDPVTRNYPYPPVSVASHIYWGDYVRPSLTPAVVTVLNLEKEYSIGDTVFLDKNKDGEYQEATDVLLDNVTVKLYKDSVEEKNFVKEIQTVKGKYLFDKLTPAKYIVVFETPEGLEATVESDTEKPNELKEANRAKSGQIVVDLIDKDIKWADAGYKEKEVKKYSIGTTVFEDLENDGIQDKEDKGIPDVKVELFKGDELIDTTTTDEKGEYSFKNLVPGEYLVKVHTPDGYQATIFSDNQEESINANRAVDGLIPVDIINKDVVTADAGFTKQSTEPTEPEAPPTEPTTTVTEEPEVPPVQPTTTITEEPEVPPVEPTTTVTEKPEIPPVEPTTTVTEKPEVPPVQPTITVTERPVQPTKTIITIKPTAPVRPVPSITTTVDQPSLPYIGTTVFEDKNNNGEQDGDEPGIPNVKVELYRDDKLIGTTYTDDRGGYVFENLEPNRNYSVKFYTPEGYQPTIESDNQDEKVNANRAKEGIILVSLKEVRVLTADAGFKRNAVQNTIATTPNITQTKPSKPGIAKTGEYTTNTWLVLLLCMLLPACVIRFKRER